MRPAVWMMFLLAFAAPFGADAAQKARISGAQTETHVSGANTPPPGGDGGVHASGAVTVPPGKAPSAKKTKRSGQREPQAAAPQNQKGSSAPGEVRQPRQPQTATVESPRAPVPPRTPDVPGGK